MVEGSQRQLRQLSPPPLHQPLCSPASLRALLLILMLIACGPAVPQDPRVGARQLRIELPRELREVSAVVLAGPGQVACVQDEKGALWLVDLHGAKQPQKLPFGEGGDYEGLAKVGDRYWVLRSDGRLLELVPDGERFRIAQRLQLPGPWRDWEGLCFDDAEQRLLVMPKDAPGDKNERELRVVFAVDPVTGKVASEPVVRFSLGTWIEQAAAAGIDLPVHRSAKGKERVALELACSELLVVPGARQLLLLSAAGGVVCRIDFTGRLLGLQRLDKAQAPQAEGMTWLADGRLLVASEGAGECGRLLVVTRP